MKVSQFLAVTVVIPGVIAGAVSLAFHESRQAQAQLPVNLLTCVSLEAGTATVYQPVTGATPRKVGTYQIIGGAECSWTWPSMYSNGITQTRVNPPIKLATTDRKIMAFPGDDEVIIIPPGVK